MHLQGLDWPRLAAENEGPSEVESPLHHQNTGTFFLLLRNFGVMSGLEMISFFLSMKKQGVQVFGNQGPLRLCASFSERGKLDLLLRRCRGTANQVRIDEVSSFRTANSVVFSLFQVFSLVPR